MKTKRIIGIALVMTLVASVSYWLGYQDGSNSTALRLNQVGTVKKIGLGFRSYRNDIARFTATGVVGVSNMATEER